MQEDQSLGITMLLKMVKASALFSGNGVTIKEFDTGITKHL